MGGVGTLCMQCSTVTQFNCYNSHILPTLRAQYGEYVTVRVGSRPMKCNAYVCITTSAQSQFFFQSISGI